MKVIIIGNGKVGLRPGPAAERGRRGPRAGPHRQESRRPAGRRRDAGYPLHGGQRRLHPGAAGGGDPHRGSGGGGDRLRRAEHRLLPHCPKAGGQAHRGPGPQPGVLQGGQPSQAGDRRKHDHQPRVRGSPGDLPAAAGAGSLQRGGLCPGPGGDDRLPRPGERRPGGHAPFGVQPPPPQRRAAVRGLPGGRGCSSPTELLSPMWGTRSTSSAASRRPPAFSPPWAAAAAASAISPSWGAARSPPISPGRWKRWA